MIKTENFSFFDLIIYSLFFHIKLKKFNFIIIQNNCDKKNFKIFKNIIVSYGYVYMYFKFLIFLNMCCSKLVLDSQ